MNESRGRRPEISHDYVSRYWPTPLQMEWLAEFWGKYAQEVYDADDIVLSVRNRFFLERIRRFAMDGGALVNIGAGLTSYPYSVDASMRFFEVDLPDMIAFKSIRRKSLEKSQSLPRKKIVGIPADLASPPERWMRSLEKELSADTVNIFLMEGISYYLKQPEWSELVRGVTERTKRGDLLMFDYWDERDSANSTLERFRRFCSLTAGIEISKFHFLSHADIEEIAAFELIELTDVIEQDVIFSTGSLSGRRTTVIPERYAVLRRT